MEGPNREDLEALKQGAVMLLQAGNRIAALSLLWSAVAIDPTDLASHRRLAATLARGGDLDAAADEFARYIEFVLPLGDVGRATLELQYGVSMLGPHPALRGAADRIADAVRALAPAVPSVSLASPPLAAPAPARLPAPRLLPKIPFRFCLHADGARHWMQLEGGTAALVPDAVRVLDAGDNVIETRLCLPLRRGEGHGIRTVMDESPVAWVVLGLPNDVVAAYEAERTWRYTFQAKFGDDWLALVLHDTGCRLGRERARTAS